MLKASQILLKIFSFRNTFWLPAGLLFLVDHAALTRSLGVPVVISGVMDPVLGSVFKIIALSLIWEHLSLLGSNKPEALSKDPWPFVVRRRWRLALVVTLLPSALHFMLFLWLGRQQMPLMVFQSLLLLPLLYGAAAAERSDFLAREGRTQKQSYGVAAGFLYLLLMLVCGLSLSFSHSPAMAPVFMVGMNVLCLALFTLFCGVLPQSQKRDPRELVLVNLASGSFVVNAVTSIVLRQHPPFFSILRALTPAAYRIREYNRVFWEDRFYDNGGLIAITAFTSNAAHAYKLAKEFRRRGARVVMGGPHVMFFPQEALTFCDSVVQGPAEDVWPQVIADYEAGQLKAVYQGSCSDAAREQVYQYFLQAPPSVVADCLQANRGCKYNCFFCANPAITGPSRLEKTVTQMITLVRRAQQCRNTLVFIDNNIYAEPVFAKEFFKALIPLRLKWSGNASIDVAEDDEAVALMKASGCQTLLIGYEIDADSLVSAKGGKFLKASNYIALTRKLQKAGIGVKAHFIFGFAQDTWASLWRLWIFCFKMSPSFTVVSYLSPFPGARYFDDVARSGDIINWNWRSYDSDHQVCTHARLGQPLLLRKGFMLIMVFFSCTTSIVGRYFLVLVIICERLYSSFK